MSLTQITQRFKSSVRWKRQDFEKKLQVTRNHLNSKWSEYEQLCSEIEHSVQPLRNEQWQQIIIAHDCLQQDIDGRDMQLFEQHLRGLESMVIRWINHRLGMLPGRTNHGQTTSPSDG